MPEIQKRLCPNCGQANDYSSQSCSFCAASLAEAKETQQESSLLAAPANADAPGLTNKELQSIAASERSGMPLSAANKKDIRLFLVAIVVGPLLLIALLALFGGLSKLSDIWRVGG